MNQRNISESVWGWFLEWGSGLLRVFVRTHLSERKPSVFFPIILSPRFTQHIPTQQPRHARMTPERPLYLPWAQGTSQTGFQAEWARYGLFRVAKSVAERLRRGQSRTFAKNTRKNAKLRPKNPSKIPCMDISRVLLSAPTIQDPRYHTSKPNHITNPSHKNFESCSSFGTSIPNPPLSNTLTTHP